MFLLVVSRPGRINWFNWIPWGIVRDSQSFHLSLPVFITRNLISSHQWSDDYSWMCFLSCGCTVIVHVNDVPTWFSSFQSLCGFCWHFNDVESVIITVGDKCVMEPSPALQLHLKTAIWPRVCACVHGTNNRFCQKCHSVYGPIGLCSCDGSWHHPLWSHKVNV